MKLQFSRVILFGTFSTRYRLMKFIFAHVSRSLMAFTLWTDELSSSIWPRHYSGLKILKIPQRNCPAMWKSDGNSIPLNVAAQELAELIMHFWPCVRHLNCERTIIEIIPRAFCGRIQCYITNSIRINIIVDYYVDNLFITRHYTYTRAPLTINIFIYLYYIH